MVQSQSSRNAHAPIGIKAAARAASESAPSGFSKRVYEGHGSSRSHYICPPTHINRVRLCPRWCSLAKCRNIKGNEATMADVRDRCCGSPTASCHGGRQAFPTCREGGQADNSHDSMRAQGRHVQVPVRQIHAVSRRRVIMATLGIVCLIGSTTIPEKDPSSWRRSSYKSLRGARRTLLITLTG